MVIKKEFKIGIFVILVLAAAFVVINILRGTDILGREKEYRGYFYDVETLVPSAPVLIRGYNAGKVSEVTYDASADRFEVICAVKKEFRVPKDSKMMLYSTSIMGGKGIRIVAGSSEEIAGDGDELQTGSEADMLSMLSSQIEPLMAKVTALLDSVTITVSNVNEVLGPENRRSLHSTLAHLERTIKNAEELSASLGGESEQVKAIIANLNRISADIVPLLDSVGVTVSNVNTITGKLADANLKGTVEKADTAINNISSVLEKIQDPLEAILKDTDDLINAIKKDPKKYMKLSVF